MKRDKNSKQMALDFSNRENETLTIEQIVKYEEEANRKIDEAFRKYVYVITFLVILSNFIFA